METVQAFGGGAQARTALTVTKLLVVTCDPVAGARDATLVEEVRAYEQLAAETNTAADAGTARRRIELVVESQVTERRFVELVSEHAGAAAVEAATARYGGAGVGVSFECVVVLCGHGDVLVSEHSMPTFAFIAEGGGVQALDPDTLVAALNGARGEWRERGTVTAATLPSHP